MGTYPYQGLPLYSTRILPFVQITTSSFQGSHNLSVIKKNNHRTRRKLLKLGRPLPHCSGNAYNVKKVIHYKAKWRRIIYSQSTDKRYRSKKQRAS